MKLEKIIEISKNRDYIFDLLHLLCLVIPGFWWFFITQKDLFDNTDIIKLLILSLIISLPAYILSDGILESKWLKKFEKELNDDINQTERLIDLQNDSEKKFKSLKRELEKLKDKANIKKKYITYSVYCSLFSATISYYFTTVNDISPSLYFLIQIYFQVILVSFAYRIVISRSLKSV